MKLAFSFPIEKPEIVCGEIETFMHSIWGKERMITQNFHTNIISKRFHIIIR